MVKTTMVSFQLKHDFFIQSRVFYH
jgi:hypothetical protein